LVPCRPDHSHQGTKEKYVAELDWVTVKIAIGGDVRNIIYRGEFNPVTVPELEILAHLHGDGAVRDVQFLKTTQSNFAEEKLRLLSKYSENTVNAIFPGRNPNMGMVLADRPGKDVEVPAKKQRPSTKTTAAQAFVPPTDEPAQVGEEF
jgi:hypothetical protein